MFRRHVSASDWPSRIFYVEQSDCVNQCFSTDLTERLEESFAERLEEVSAKEMFLQNEEHVYSVEDTISFARRKIYFPCSLDHWYRHGPRHSMVYGKGGCDGHFTPLTEPGPGLLRPDEAVRTLGVELLTASARQMVISTFSDRRFSVWAKWGQVP